MSTFVYSNLTESNIHAVLAFTYADWWATQAKAAGYDTPAVPRVSGKYQNVFWYLNPPEAYALQIGLIYATVWLGAIGWDILSTISFDLRLIRQTRWRSFPSTVHSVGYLCSRYSTLIWLTITIASLVAPSVDCGPKTRAAGFAFALSISSMHLIFMMRTISIWHLNHRVIAPLLLLWLIILAGSLVLGFVAQTEHIPGSYFCTGSNNKGFQVSEVFVVVALVLFDLLCLALTVAKLNKLGWRGIIKGFIPRHRSHYDAEDWAAMLVHRTTLFCLVQFVLLLMFVILQVIPSLAPYRSMQVVATTTIGVSMAGRIFRQSWRLTREHSPANVNRPPSYHPGWADEHSGPSSGAGSGAGVGAGAGAESARGVGGAGTRATGTSPVPMVAKMPTVRKSPLSGGAADEYDLNESYVEGEFKFVKPFLLTGVGLGALGASLTGGAGGSGIEAGEDGGAAAAAAAGSTSMAPTGEAACTPAERYAAEHSSRTRAHRDRSADREGGGSSSRPAPTDIEALSLIEAGAAGLDEIDEILQCADGHDGGRAGNTSEMVEVRSLHTLASVNAERGVPFGNYSLASGSGGGGGGAGASGSGSGAGAGAGGAVGIGTGAESASLLKIDLGRRRTFPTLWAEAAKHDQKQQYQQQDPSTSWDGDEMEMEMSERERDRERGGLPTAPAFFVSNGQQQLYAGGGSSTVPRTRSYVGGGGGADPSSFSRPSTAATAPSRPSTSTGTQAPLLPFGGSCESRLGTPNRMVGQGQGGYSTYRPASSCSSSSHQPPQQSTSSAPGPGPGPGPAPGPTKDNENRRSFFLTSPPLSASPIPASRSRMVYDFQALKEASEMRHVDGCCGTEDEDGDAATFPEEEEEEGGGRRSPGASAPARGRGGPGKGMGMGMGRGRSVRPKTAPMAASRTMRRVAVGPQHYQPYPSRSGVGAGSHTGAGAGEVLPTVFSSGHSIDSESVGADVRSSSHDPLTTKRPVESSSPSSSSRRKETGRRGKDQPEISSLVEGGEGEELELELDAQSAFRQVVDQDADARLSSTSLSTTTTTTAAAAQQQQGDHGRQSVELTEEVSFAFSAFESSSSAAAAGVEADDVFAFNVDTTTTAGSSSSSAGAAAAMAADAIDARRPGTATSFSASASASSAAAAAAAADDGRPRTSRGGPVHVFGSTEVPGSAGAMALEPSSGAQPGPQAQQVSRERVGSFGGRRRMGSGGVGMRPGSSGGWVGARPGTAGRG